ncbi:MAG: double-cubane-cluster-containing anaerobic reductase [bacterium]|nr:double-cubane-cluster-containing anaerobic reductase [bacterium]
MTAEYTEMWRGLGLNLENHAGLLNVLSEAYTSIYLSQKNRPEGMKYFDFVISEVHGLRVKEIMDAKAQGRKVVGTFCVYVPEEIVLAVGGVCVGLCAGADVGGAEAEKYIPTNTCALIKAFMGFKLARLCPYVESTDLIVGETTCDGKKKAYESFGEITGKMYVMELPSMKNRESRALWRAEVARFGEKMTAVSGRPLTVEGLREGARLVNGKRKALQRLSRLRAADPPPISGLDALLINQISFYDDPVRFTEMTNRLCDELDDRVKQGVGVVPKGATRILLSGSPMAIPNWKMHNIIEGASAVVVGEESCVGERNHRDLLDESFSTVHEGFDRIAERYLGIDCACFTPNDDRLANIRRLTDSLKADGVIHYALQFCTPYTMEAIRAERKLKSEEVPFLRIETDYSAKDAGQLKTRVEAFLEMIR